MSEPTDPPVPKNEWEVTLSLSNVYGSTLYQFFDSSSSDSVVSLLDHIEIENIEVTYKYNGPQTASFTSKGLIKLGDLPLSLSFNHDSKGWEFKGELKFGESKPPSTTIGKVAAHIFGPDVEFPDFVANIELKLPESKNSAGVEMFSLKKEEENPDSGESTGPDAAAAAAPNPKTGSKSDVFFTAWVEVDGFRFQAFQFQGAPTDEKNPKTKPAVQRAFRLSVKEIPQVKVDMIGDLPQPFDEMVFFYVQPQKAPGAPAGLTHGAVKKMNEKLSQLGDGQELRYKALKKEEAYQPNDVVIRSGMHFMLIRKDPQQGSIVAFDYVFGQAKSKSKKAKALTTGDLPPTAMVDEGEGEDTQPEPPAKAPYEKKVGPITIRNLGLKYSLNKPPSLSLLLDASVLLGPIGVGLLGFSITLEFGAGKDLFKNIPTPTFAIEGLAASFDRSPLILAGMFKHVDKTYQGAATLSFKPYLFQAAGFYGDVKDKTGTEFKSTFVYFILDGPLATLEFAEIRGVTGGFGYNTFLRFPTVTNVPDFPLISTSGPNDPQSALNTLMGGDAWFFPKNNSFWLAAGMTVLAFEILDIKAVIAVEWDPKVKIGLFGVATADMPAGTDTKFAHVQLGLVAVLDLDAGTFKIEGQLTPASYVLDPSCHLTGGFAFYTWFGGGPSSGDFVFTIGGYHRSYKPPAQYPNPPRLAISWSYDSSISIRGEAYFAITPKVCMGGGRLDASLTLGALYAFFDAYADFLINYKPFHFSADGGLSVGVRFTLDLWICTVHINIEISATLYIEGPPIAGRVHVNFWVFGFDINFGNKITPDTKARTLRQFIQQVLQADLAKGKTADATDPPPVIFSCNQGLIASDDNNAKSEPNATAWNVRGAVFQFTVGCKFAVKEAAVVTDQPDAHGDPIPAYKPTPNPKDIFSKPMHLDESQPLSSVLTVKIKPKQTTLALTASDHDYGVSVWNSAKLNYKSVPMALWGPYKSDEDPNAASNPNQIEGLLKGDNPAVSQATGITISSPLPVLSNEDKIPPFDYKTFFIQDAGGPYHFPDINQQQDAWEPENEDTSQGAWETVRKQWDGPPGFGGDAADAFVKLWANQEYFKWDLTKDQTITGQKPGNILLKDEETFGSSFLEVPRLGTAAA
ncbi:hypothetical protein MW887_000697 [Aspergillus wentii]|nr:hypothetical protein MW887_000697 [Aspergillus wentii]